MDPGEQLLADGTASRRQIGQAAWVEHSRIDAVNVRRRRIVEQSGQKLPLPALALTHGPEETENGAPRPIQEQQVGMFSGDFRHERALCRVAQLVATRAHDLNHTFEAGLLDPQDTSTLEVLAKQHAEGRGLCGILEALLCQVQTRMHAPCGKEKATGAGG